ncbi:MAG: zinc carboxypeptidase [Cyclobacteriaceae bacterium]|nr:zinc carboxypeptidase [Cyclobacteriaceae bacterium]
MKLKILTILLAQSIGLSCFAQVDLSYYLPEGTSYNPAIPTPKSVVGHEVGEWHITHDKLVNYMQALANASDRVSLEVTGHTYEARPLLLLTITSPKNQQNIEAIRQQHIQLSDPAKSAGLDVTKMPVVFYLGCSIHGNEPSGANAGLVMAYHLAAAQGPEIEKYLENTVVLFDPSFNPDGLQRFSTWANSHKSKLISADGNDMEHNEAWPGGRTNHYWFDLNRDWLPGQHPESQARIRQFHRWKPNILTDHHEQGTDATFFFMPGEPTRVNPRTPKMNQELTKKLGEFHAKALDKIGSLYFTQEGYDDFYYGKGSTYPDVQGCIGILFEQASSRGHAQESENGLLRFPFTIRNHFTTMLSSLEGANSMREELLNYQRGFYKDAMNEASKDPVKAIVFGSNKDKARAFHLAEMAARQEINIYPTTSTQTFNGRSYEAGSSYVIPLNQPQYRLIKSMFEKLTTFEDSLFYDISSWTLPLAFNLEYDELKSVPSLGEKLTSPQLPIGEVINDKASFAYAFEPFGYYSPRAIYRLISHGIRIKVAHEVFHHPSGKRFERGSIMIPVEGQSLAPDQIAVYMREVAAQDGINVYGFNTGLDYKGVSLGSRTFDVVNKPSIAVLMDIGISPTDAGEIWHLLDQRYHIPVTMLPIPVLNYTSIDRYTTIIIPPGRYNGISESTKEKLKTWVQNGGTLIGLEDAVNWFTTAGFGKFEMKKNPEKKDHVAPRPYEFIDEDRGAQVTSGVIFEANVDLSNPLLYGYYNTKMPMFKSNNYYMEKANSPYANPIVYGDNSLMSGYISKENYAKMKNSSAVGVASLGRGKVIGFTENLTLRAFWYGTNKMLMNAIFYGPMLNGAMSR